MVFLGSWKVQSSLYNSAGSRRPYWQLVNSRECRSLKRLEGWCTASLFCPLFCCQIHQGVVVCPTENSHNRIFCLPHLILPWDLSCNSLTVLTLETLLLMTFSEESSVKLPMSNCTFSPAAVFPSPLAVASPALFSLVPQFLGFLMFAFAASAGQLWHLCPLPFSIAL